MTAPECNYEQWMADARRAGTTQISAMIRVRNEEAFLYPAVKSIEHCVDEIVLIDNLSTDRTPEVIEALHAENPDQIRVFRYPHQLAKVGGENYRLAAEKTDSPRLLSNYYNWCLDRCTMPFVLKWDADMVALDCFSRRLDDWRCGDRAVMVFRGANVHADRQHLLAAKITDKAQLAALLDSPGIPAWTTWLTYDYYEPRLFPRHAARYDNRLKWTQILVTPFYEASQRHEYSVKVEEPCFLHFKFCKDDPCAGYSSDLKRVIMNNLTVGPDLEPAQRLVMRRWQLDQPAFSAETRLAGSERKAA